MNIKVNDRFNIKTDPNNFIVEEIGIITTKDKETGIESSRVGVTKTTYHPNLAYAIKHIMTQSSKNSECEDLKSVLVEMQELYSKIEGLIGKYNA